MVSKADIEPEQICLVDLDNCVVCGAQPHTSEIRLHLTIYKTVPKARAVVHCHPPHATAYAITGITPPVGILPEHEVFVGPVPITPYETPGTQAFADTVIPYARTHNTLLLANHGVVAWADTLTHAEWCVEVLDTYCRILILAAQLGQPITKIPERKIADLLRIKQRLGLPDERNVVLAEANEPLEVPASSALIEDLANEVLGELNER
jgi:L-fuculose-phosphate aldolase